MSIKPQAISIEAAAAIGCRDCIIISLPNNALTIKEFSANLIRAIEIADLPAPLSNSLVKDLERINTTTREPELKVSWCDPNREVTSDQIDDLERIVLQVGGRLDSTRGHSGYNDSPDFF